MALQGCCRPQGAHKLLLRSEHYVISSSKIELPCCFVGNGFRVFDTAPLLAGVDANAMDHNIQIDQYTKSVYATHYDRYQSFSDDRASTMAGRNGGLIEHVPLQNVGGIRSAARALGSRRLDSIEYTLNRT